MNPTMPSATFAIIDWRPFQKNTLQAFLSLQLPSGLVIRDCTFHQKGDSRWIGLPARPYEEPGGGKSWSPIVEFASKEARDRFQAAALAAIDQYLAATMGARK